MERVEKIVVGLVCVLAAIALASLFVAWRWPTPENWRFAGQNVGQAIFIALCVGNWSSCRRYRLCDC